MVRWPIDPLPHAGGSELGAPNSGWARRNWSGALLLLALFCAVDVGAQNYTIDWFTIDGGGGTSANGAFAVTGTIGQPAAAKSSGGNYAVEGGFWSIVAAVQTPGAPLLKVKRAGGNVEISWSASGAGGFALEETGSLAGTVNWSTVSTSPVTVNDERVVTVPAGPGHRFFRLRKP